VGAAAGLAGSLISSNASTSAANTQAQASNTASQNQLNEFNQTKATLAPYVKAGTSANAALLASLGLGGSGTNILAANGINGLTFQPTQAQLEATPGYKFDLNQGEQGVAASNAAAGRGVSGAALGGAAAYATGLANNTLTTQQGIFQQNLGNVLDPLASEANLGENAAATTGAQGVAATQAANSDLIGGANAQAAGTVGSANALTSGLSAAGGTPLNYLLYNQLLGSSGATAGGVGSAVGDAVGGAF
jgi:hypothetical protein